MVPWDFITSGGFAIGAVTVGYVAGTLRPIIGQDYHTDRKWCEHLSELYRDAIKIIKEYSPIGNKECFLEISGKLSEITDEFEDHLNNYPNYRREERNQAKDILRNLDEINKTWPDKESELESASTQYLRVHDPTDIHDPDVITIREFNKYKKEVEDKIRLADESLSYGKLYFIKSIILGDRAI